MKRNILIGGLLMLSATFLSASDKNSEFQQFLDELPVMMGEVGSLINRCALQNSQTFCDQANALVGVMKVTMELMPEAEKNGHSLSIAMLQGFLQGYRAELTSEN